MLHKQPVYLNLFKIKLPITGIISFAHRVTGVLLFFSIPFVIYLLQLSLQSQQGFDQTINLLNHPLLMIIQVLIAASVLLHLFAGIRFLLMDIDIGHDVKSAERSSWVVIFATLVSVFLFGILRFF